MFMRRCLQLAKNGRQNAKPNPMVGAVIVSADGRIIGEGYHVRCGEGHAEVNAFASVRPEDEPLLHEATIYVSLEPCSHYGKTPPCADLVVKKGVKRCVCGCVDPFAKVQGRGIQKIREAGIEVTVGVLEKECLELNKRFITYNTHKRPYVILKWAQTVNGFLDDRGKGMAISSPFTKMLSPCRPGPSTPSICCRSGPWPHGLLWGPLLREAGTSRRQTAGAGVPRSSSPRVVWD